MSVQSLSYQICNMLRVAIHTLNIRENIDIVMICVKVQKIIIVSKVCQICSSVSSGEPIYSYDSTKCNIFWHYREKYCLAEV